MNQFATTTSLCNNPWLVEDDVGSFYEERIGVMKRKTDRVNNS
jgi:hypothetical protein